MKLKLIFYCIFFASVLNAQAAKISSYIQTKDGIIVYTDSSFTGTSNAVKLEVIADNIIRVIKASGKEFASNKSLITVYSKSEEVYWNVVSDKENITLQTKSLVALIEQKTGLVSFFDRNGKKIVAEKLSEGCGQVSTIFEGKTSLAITQTFESTDDDAWYGLGQHQNGVMNYKGQQVNFFQNNTEVAIPFLVSNKNYGILWDNYSLTKVGDIRPLHPLSSFQLFSKKGEEGWLTATYSNDKNSPEKSVVEKAESDINMEFLGDSKIQLPKEFIAETGVVTWEGSIASNLVGLHQLKLTFGGTINIWLNNKLVLSKWRKAWNPASALIPLNINSNEKIPVRIEWIPEGKESYLSLKWQEPILTKDRNSFSFCSEAGKQEDYYFIYGKNIDSVISGYRELTGKSPIVPKWALGFWQSRERYKTQNEILSTIEEFRNRKIPIDNIVLDWNYWREPEWGSQEFDETRFPSPDSMISVLHKNYHTQLMISVWPKFYEGISTYNEFNKKGWLYKRNVADKQRDWIGKGYVSTFYDAFNDSARKGFWNLIDKKIFRKGIDAWWMDASEPDILSNVSPEKRKLQMEPTAMGSSAEYLNAYPLQNAKGIYEGQRSVESNKRVFLLTRSAFAGSQRYGAAVWSGDIGSTWDDLKNQISAGVNYSLSGLPYWTMDIGGFVVPEKFEKPTEDSREEWRELLTRWSQFGSFVPLFRVHGQYPYREIFNVAPEEHPAYKSFMYYDKLRYRLLPYIYSLAGAAYHENSTIMRGLVMDFATDTAVLNITDQYMFGPSLLINPVYQYKEYSRSVYLPKSEGWYNLYSDEYYTGGQKIRVDAPYEQIPVFVKAGSIVPFGTELQYTSEKKADTIMLRVYTGADASFSLYEDEGTNYNYEKGNFSIIPIRYNEKTHTLSIEERKGSFDGMLKKRIFLVNTISSKNKKTLQFKTYDVSVKYEGKKVIIKI